jgi:GNAT superfamily N-acetyltransferase
MGAADRRVPVPLRCSEYGAVCDALVVSVGDGIRIVPFNPAFQDAFRLLVLDGMAERWGEVDPSLNADIDDIEGSYDQDNVLVALDGAVVVGTGILVLRSQEAEIVRMAVQRNYRRRGVATRLLSELIDLASELGVNRLVVETNAKWTEARNLYEKAGFKFTHVAPGAFGDESFYELAI